MEPNITKYKYSELQDVFVLFVIVALIIITRGHGLDTVIHLPDFTLPALLIAGVYLRGFIAPFVIIVSAIAIDNYAIVYKGISANCITPAYSILPFSYLVMYFSGRYIDSLVIKTFKKLMKIVLVITSASVAQWLIATMSYYAFTDAMWSDFMSYALKWAPIELSYMFYWMIAVIMFLTFSRRFVPNFYFISK